MEFIDVLDENGNKTGIVRNRKLVYKNGDWHRTVHIWIINSNNEILVQKRAADKQTYPNLWAISVAGHVMSGENSLEAALREIREEINVDINPELLKCLFSLKRKEPFNGKYLNIHDDVYLLKLDLDIDKLKLQREELTDVKFIYYKDLENKFISKDEKYVPYCEEHKLLFKYLDEKIGGMNVTIN